MVRGDHGRHRRLRRSPGPVPVPRPGPPLLGGQRKSPPERLPGRLSPPGPPSVPILLPRPSHRPRPLDRSRPIPRRHGPLGPQRIDARQVEGSDHTRSQEGQLGVGTEGRPGRGRHDESVHQPPVSGARRERSTPQYRAAIGPIRESMRQRGEEGEGNPKGIGRGRRGEQARQADHRRSEGPIVPAAGRHRGGAVRSGRGGRSDQGGGEGGTQDRDGAVQRRESGEGQFS
mmetsp:Transcript_29300/g.86803  ORF Transcript_29300/g.86803 Transcript_29300/m.86803 type:complete len:230 (+) Transcript_29300:265-954(+)